jgi:hypothetical protein
MSLEFCDESQRARHPEPGSRPRAAKQHSAMLKQEATARARRVRPNDHRDAIGGPRLAQASGEPLGAAAKPRAALRRRGCVHVAVVMRLALLKPLTDCSAGDQAPFARSRLEELAARTPVQSPPDSRPKALSRNFRCWPVGAIGSPNGLGNSPKNEPRAGVFDRDPRSNDTHPNASGGSGSRAFNRLQRSVRVKRCSTGYRWMEKAALAGM